MRRTLLLILVLIIGISVYLFWGNNFIKITEYDYSNSKIPAAFDGFTIAQVSDLHNKTFGGNQKNLLAKLKAAAPDIIVITGDVIDRRHYNLDAALYFVKGAVKIAPVYYVTGNHEAWLDEFEVAKASMIESGAIFMDDTEATIINGDSSIKILGVSDPDFLTTSYDQGNDVTKMSEQLAKWSSDENFKILLTHRPELFDLYAENNMDLVFAGHTHGGQIRIPFIGGVVAPDQGWFPQYTKGQYLQDASTMFVSSGLGNSLIPIRINNRPEIVVVRFVKMEQYE
jgi:predicted MPP superfamily phosphohydrolase